MVVDGSFPLIKVDQTAPSMMDSNTLEMGGATLNPVNGIASGGMEKKVLGEQLFGDVGTGLGTDGRMTSSMLMPFVLASSPRRRTGALRRAGVLSSKSVLDSSASPSESMGDLEGEGGKERISKGDLPPRVNQGPIDQLLADLLSQERRRERLKVDFEQKLDSIDMSAVAAKRLAAQWGSECVLPTLKRKLGRKEGENPGLTSRRREDIRSLQRLYNRVGLKRTFSILTDKDFTMMTKELTSRDCENLYRDLRAARDTP
jgi:hypothetical protein